MTVGIAEPAKDGETSNSLEEVMEVSALELAQQAQTLFDKKETEEKQDTEAEEDYVSEFEDAFDEYTIKDLNGKDIVVKPWTMTKAKPLSKKVSEFLDKIGKECPELDLKNLIPSLPKLLRLLPDDFCYFVCRTLNIPETQEDEDKFLDTINFVITLKLVKAIIVQNLLGNVLKEVQTMVADIFVTPKKKE